MKSESRMTRKCFRKKVSLLLKFKETIIEVFAILQYVNNQGIGLQLVIILNKSLPRYLAGYVNSTPLRGTPRPPLDDLQSRSIMFYIQKGHL